MAIFQVHLVRGGRLKVAHEASGAEELAFHLSSRRWLFAELIGEADQLIDPPARILIQTHQVQMIVEL